MAELGSSERWRDLAVHSADGRRFTRVGDGLELAIVARNPKSGATAMFQRITKGAVDPAEARQHTHFADCHTLVLSGEIEVAFESGVHRLTAGDYLRVPAETPHVQTLHSDDAELFVMTDGNPGIDFVVPARWDASQGPAAKLDMAAGVRQAALDQGAPEDDPGGLRATLAGLWEELLDEFGDGAVPVGPDDDLLAAGGTSILAVMFLSRVYEELGVDVSFRDLLAEPTIRGLSRRIIDSVL